MKHVKTARIISAFLVLSIGAFNYRVLPRMYDGCTQTVKAEAALESPMLYQYSASLEGDIGMNFYMRFPDYMVDQADYKVVLMTNDPAQKVEETITNSFWDTDTSSYKFTIYVNAKQMNDSISVSVYNGSSKISMINGSNSDIGDSFNCNVSEYLSALALEYPLNTALKDLTDAASNYGQYVQKLFNYNASGLSSLPDVELTLDEQTDLNNFEKSYTVGEAAPTGLNVQMSLVLKTKTTMNIYLSADDIETFCTGKKVVVDTVETDLVLKGDMYCISIPDIAAAQLGNTHTIKINDGCTLEVSALSYAKAVVDSTTASKENKNAMKALYKYYKAAKTYYPAG